MGTEVDVIEARRKAYREDHSDSLIALVNLSNRFLKELEIEYYKWGYETPQHKAQRLGYEVQIKIAKEVLAERGIEVE